VPPITQPTTCLGRVKFVLDQWKDKGVKSDWTDKKETAIKFRDCMYGTGRFTNVVERADGDVQIAVRLFASIEGNDRSVKEAYAYLLNLPYIDPKVTIQRDMESGNVAASVTFACVPNLHQLEVNVGIAMNKLTTYLEARYDRMVAELQEMGVTLNKGEQGS
jgi:hypothetical protein